MGLFGRVVEAPGQLAAALGDAIAAHSPAVIEIRVDPEVCPPLGDRAQTISGFVPR
jgi:thiamine pyrophosphate-dependent acetolactate synthase large subunit-like protein